MKFDKRSLHYHAKHMENVDSIFKLEHITKVFLFVCLFEAGFLCVALTVLELAMYTGMAQTQRSCLCLPKARIKDTCCLHTPAPVVWVVLFVCLF